MENGTKSDTSPNCVHHSENIEYIEDTTAFYCNEPEIRPIVFHRKGNDYCILIGGVINQGFISADECEQNISFSTIMDENCSFFTDDDTVAEMKIENVRTYHIDATGTNQTEIEFNRHDFESVKNISCFGLINNEQPPIYTEQITINNEGTYEIDFDSDSEVENIIIRSSHDNVVVSLKNKEGIKTIAEFNVDGIYTSSFELFAIDINQDGNKELIICLDGHDYSTEVYTVSSKESKQVLGYYMGN